MKYLYSFKKNRPSNKNRPLFTLYFTTLILAQIHLIKTNRITEREVTKVSNQLPPPSKSSAWCLYKWLWHISKDFYISLILSGNYSLFLKDWKNINNNRKAIKKNILFTSKISLTSSHLFCFCTEIPFMRAYFNKYFRSY